MNKPLPKTRREPLLSGSDRTVTLIIAAAVALCWAYVAYLFATIS